MPGLDPDIQTAAAMAHWVYILASGRNGTLYVGVTGNLPRRIYEHKAELTPGFTSKYGVKTLVYAEAHDLAVGAIQREKNIKHWSRKWKLELIEGMNPTWSDLFDFIL
jgi:putative endonuclease